MPELPEVTGLVGFLAERIVGQAIVGVELASIAVLKTYDPPPQALEGLVVDAVTRHGKWIDIEASGLHVVVHLSRAGWLRWSDNLPTTVLRPGKSPIAVRFRFDDGGGFDLTEAGKQKRLAVYVVKDVEEVPAIAGLGIDPLSQEFTPEAFRALLAGRRTQIKGLLRDQSELSGVGNAYSDEVLHVAKVSPFAIAGNLTEHQVDALYDALISTLNAAVASAAGKPAKELKDAKRAGMRVHGRTGEACPECGDVVREVSFADRSLQYCATCQTGSKPLADRRMSRLLK